MKPKRTFSKFVGILTVGRVLSSVDVNASQWTLSQFPSLAPVITFETGSTALPGINGLQLSGGDATFAVTNYNPNQIVFGHQYFGNLSTAGGYTYLDITFSQPQQAVGAYIINADSFNKITGVTEVVYDKDNNVLESASQSYPAPRQPPVFLGVGETTTNIYKVEWRYAGATGFFGVDNVIYSPGPVVVLTNIQFSAGNLVFNFQTLPGHTNTVQICPGLAIGGWTNLTSILGDGGNRQINFPTTNSPAGYFRVQVQ